MRNVNRPLLILAMLIPALGIAQSPEGSWDNLKQLTPGQKIEVVDMSLKSLKGAFVSYSEEAISLRTDEGELGVRRDDVFRVSSREKSKRLRNTLIGAAIGAGVGVAIGAGAATTGVHETGEEYFVMAIFTPIGAGAGAGIGAAIPSYQTIYRAPKSRQ